MKSIKTLLIAVLAVIVSACIFTGCTSEKTKTPAESTPTPVVEATETPVPTKTPVPTPIKTPTPAQEDMYTWEYKFNEDDPTTINPCIVLKEGIDWRDLVEVVVPAYIDGYKVTHIGKDLLGGRSVWGLRKGLCKVYDPNKPDEWTDPHCAIEKITFPNTIEVYEGETFWFAPSSLEEIVFEGTENVRYIGRKAFHDTPAITYMTEDAGGYLVINGILVNALAAEEIVFPEDVIQTEDNICCSNFQDYDIVKVIRINDGCQRIGRYLTEAIHPMRGGTGYLINLTDIYIPASVTEIHEDFIWWLNFGAFNFHVVEGSYADEWLKNNTLTGGYKWPADKIIYDME